MKNIFYNHTWASTLSILSALILFVSSCTQNKGDYNSPDQKDYMNRWLVLLKDYKKANNNVVEDELIEKCTELFNERKAFTNWKGKVKEINSFDDYAKLIVSHMTDYDEESAAEFHLIIYKKSPCYDLIKTLKESDDINFSGTIDREISITGNGKITEPELVVNCTMVNGIENMSEDISNSKESNSSSDIGVSSSYESNVSSSITNSSSYDEKTCSWCGKTFSGTHYTHLGKLAPCQSSDDRNSIGIWCSMKCCSEARRSSCPSCR